MKKLHNLPVLALSLAAFLTFSSAVNAAEISSANFCNLSPGGISSGPVTIDRNCVIYENYNGASNGDLTVTGANLTLHHNLVWYPSYKINIVGGGRIFMNAGAKIRQTRLCVKDADGDGYGDVTGMKDNAGNPIPGSNVKQLDMVAADDCYKLAGYRPREAMFNLAYVDQDDTNPVAQNNVISDRELISLGFEVNTVNDPSALGNPVRLVGDNLFVCTDTSCTGSTPTGFGNLIVQNKVGIGIGNPTEKLSVNGNLLLNKGGDDWMLLNPSLDVTSLSPGASNIGASITSRKFAHLLMDIYANDANDSFAVRTDTNYDGTLDSIPLVVKTGGNVGVGTTSPIHKLTVGNGSFPATLAGFGVGLGGNSYISVTDGTRLTFMGADSSGGIVGNYTNHDLVLRTNNTERLRITANGKIQTPDTNNPYLVLDSSSLGGNNAEQSAQFSLGESGRGGASLHLAYTGDGYSYIGMGALDANNLPTNYAMRLFYTNRDIYMPGSISIDNTINGRDPDNMVTSDIADDYNIASNSNNSGYPYAAFEIRELNFGGAQTGAAGEAPRISFHWGGRVASQIGMGSDGVIRTFNNPGTGFEIFAASTIRSYGTGGIVFQDYGGGWFMSDSTWIRSTVGKYTFMQSGFDTSNASGVGCGGGLGGGYMFRVCGTMYASGSSRNYKENINKLEIDSSKIYDLKPVSYDYKKDYEKFGKPKAGGREFGLIAEDTAAVIPELGLTLDGKITNVDYEKLSILLLSEVQKHEKTIKELKSQNQSLEERLKSIEEKIGKLNLE